MADRWKWHCYGCSAKGRGTYREQAQESTAHLFLTGHSVGGQRVRDWRFWRRFT